MRMTEEVQVLSTAGRKHPKGQKIANLDLSGVVKIRQKNSQNYDTLERKSHLSKESISIIVQNQDGLDSVQGGLLRKYEHSFSFEGSTTTSKPNNFLPWSH